MKVKPADGLPDISHLPSDQKAPIEDQAKDILDIPVLIIGRRAGGVYLLRSNWGQLGVVTLLVDDKSKLGGKLVLQTHRFLWVHQGSVRRHPPALILLRNLSTPGLRI